jgi:hypothetical protein
MQTEKWIENTRRRLARRILGGLPLDPCPPEMAPLEQAQLEEIRSLFPMLKFFIFGYPRSGTTILMRLVDLHPQIHCGREAHFFTCQDDATNLFADAEIRQWLERRSNRWTSGQNLEGVLVRLIADYIMEREARQLGKVIVGDKTPNANAGQAVRRMHALYPDARLIYIVRDGRDAALSHRFQHFIDQPEYLPRPDRRIRLDFAHDSRPYLEKKRSLFTRESIEEEARSWANNVTETPRLGQELLGEHFFCLRYEDLLASPVDTMAHIWMFLGVEPGFPGVENAIQTKLAENPGAEAQRQKNEDLASRLQRGKKGGWQDYFTPRDRQVFKDLAGAELIRWRYEKDREW